MEKESARNQTLEQLHERHKQVVKLHKKAIKIMKIGEPTGLTYPTVRATIDRFEEGGWVALRPARRGRPKGGDRILNAAQEDATNQGKTRGMIIEETFDTEKFCEFLQALIKDAGKKVFLILDNLRVHHSNIVRAWVAERKEHIELFYLPSYSPPLNPEERLNADLKQEMSKRVPVRTKAKLRQAATEHMTRLEQTPKRVIGYFLDRHVKYAT